MPSFDNLFAEPKDDFIVYNGNKLFQSDKFSVKNGDILIASIEKTNSRRRQGFVIDITGYCEMDGEVFKKGKGLRVTFWQDTMPKEVKIKVFTKKDTVLVYNIWESENYYILGDVKKEFKTTEYFVNGAAMIIEEFENGRRYCCNDGVPDEDFDDIIFTVRKEVS
jgi:hypothetical protein